MARIPWEMDFDTWEQEYLPTILKAHQARRDGDAIQYQTLVDVLKSIPGYPMHAHPTDDVIVVVPPSRSITVVPRLPAA